MELELRCQQNAYKIAVDPQPDWSFENLILELDSIKNAKKHGNLEFSGHFNSPIREFAASKENGRSTRGFLMHVSDDGDSSTDSLSDDEAHRSVSFGRRFVCDDIDVSDDSENEQPTEMPCLMAKVGLAESALIELNHEYLLSTTEATRSMMSSIEAELVDEYEIFSSLINKIDRHKKMQQGMERKYDLHYKRTLAEALDNHLTSIQRDLEQISQLEERRLRDDAAREDAKRKEKSLLAEKLLQERIKAEEKARLKAEMAEKAKEEAIAGEKRAAEEALARLASETSKDATLIESRVLGVDVKKDTQSARIMIKASENALELEKRRRQIYEEVTANNAALMASGNPLYHVQRRTIGRLIRTTSSTEGNIRIKAEALLKAINSPQCPQSLSIELFADKILTSDTIRVSSNLYAICRVIVLVTSKVPNAMDVFLAKLNGLCIYTVPKHIRYIKDVFETKESYLKAIGFTEVNGVMDTTETYVERLRCYMGLYGALVQTEIRGFQNSHGLREGWAWLARFLNYMPANAYTLAALCSFLEMAGYALYMRYRNQFEKLLSIISRDFLKAIEASGSKSESISKDMPKLRHVLQSYKEEPKDLRPLKVLDSSSIYD